MIVTHEFVVMADGLRLAVDIYRPDHDRVVPVLLEALPYRKDDLLERNDYQSYCRDYDIAVCRADIRGTGSSEGWASGEYSPDEVEDLRVLIGWLAGQPWCNGKVGMFGWSYSGFNSLQMAASGIPELAAVVAVYASDDRYTDDVHYAGGILRLVDIVDYPAYMCAMNALPPVPELAGDQWQEQWRERIERGEPWIVEWIRSQRPGGRWLDGSVRTRYDEISCPVMVIAGWMDGYTNIVPRLAQALSARKVPWQAIVGPWSHMDSETSLPGPWTNLTPEMMRWFDRWLRDEPADVEAEPAIRVYQRSWAPPAPDAREVPGRWVGLAADAVVNPPEVRLPLGGGVVDYDVRPSVGVSAWNSCAGSLPWGQPQDQRGDDAMSVTVDWPIGVGPLATRDFFGQPRLTVRVSADRPVAFLVGKLSEVHPDGTSTLISRAQLNLSYRDGTGAPSPLTPGVPVLAELAFDTIGWTLTEGNRLRLALAGTDWPNTAAPPEPVSLRLDLGSAHLTLPVLTGAVDIDQPGTPCAEPDPPAVSDVVWRVERDVLARVTTCRTRYGSTWTTARGWPVTDDYQGSVSVNEQDFGQRADAVTRFEIGYPDARVVVESVVALAAGRSDFDLSVDIAAWLNGEPFAQATWAEVIPRDHG